MDYDNVRPREDVLFVERKGSWDEFSRGENPGLVVVEDRPELEVGLVLAAGPGKDQGERPLQVSQGDYVLFGRYAGAEYDREHLFVREAEVHAVVGS